ncbi:MAG: peptidylprolyl isomerase [Rhodospirillaceae bacterium]|jgi:peptidyl-prolyl cis-trans isomerase C
MKIARVVLISLFSVAVTLTAEPVFAADKNSAEKDPIFAVVNGEEIRKSTLDDARELLPQELQALPAHTLYPALMNQVINSVLIAGEARRKNLHKDDTMKRRLKRISDQILERAFLVKYIEDNLTEKALKARYQKMVEDTKNQSEVHARHILVKTEKKAHEIIKKLRNGENFEQLAKTHSTGPSGANGGDLGYFRKGQMLPAFSKAAFAMKKGKFSKRPVQTQYGWHVIKVEGRRTAKPPAIEEVREQLVSDLSSELGSNLVKQLRKDAKIDIRKAGQSALDNAPKKQ